MRRLKLPTHGSKEYGRKLRVVITPVKEVLKTRLRGLAELRVKESDRFSAIVDGLGACGVTVAANGDDIVIQGCGGPIRGGAEIPVNLDHRIAMAFLVAGMASSAPVGIDDAAAIGTSFPGFVELMNGIGGNIGPVAAE